jgi:hypothetical protein
LGEEGDEENKSNVEEREDEELEELELGDINEAELSAENKTLLRVMKRHHNQQSKKIDNLTEVVKAQEKQIAHLVRLLSRPSGRRNPRSWAEVASAPPTSTPRPTSTPHVHTSHMTSFARRIGDYTICSGIVKSSSKASMPIKGQGHVVMDCELSDGAVSKFKIPVFHVPGLERPLLSWRKL